MPLPLSGPQPPPPRTPRPARRRFATTRWSLVLAAGQGATPQARKALGELCQLYQAPLQRFFRCLGRPEEDARDLTQDIFTRLLETNDLATADPRKGRFRTWLLTRAKSHLANVGKSERALKRGGDQLQLGLSEADPESSLIPARGLTPEQEYERRWAETLLANAWVALREECQRLNKEPVLEKLKGTLMGVEEDSHARIAGELGKTAGAVKTEVCRLRRRLRALVRAEVAHTVEPEDFEDEMKFFFSALRAP